eukprot:COSAG06_NODE_1083_length_10780_cov_2.547608_8_plen_96_part_00
MATLVGCEDGEQTGSKYCTFYEVKYAFDHDTPIIPLKLYKGEWPPAPKHKDGTVDIKAKSQNSFVFTPGKVYKEMEPSDAEAAARYIVDAVNLLK